MQTKLLVVGDGGAPTGYARVIHSILRTLPTDSYEIHHLAVNYLGDPHDASWKLYPAGIRGDAYGVNRLREMVESIKPDLVFMVADLWVQNSYLEQIEKCSAKPKVVVYSPVDAGPVDAEWVARFRMATKVVAFTEYAKSEIAAALSKEAPSDLSVIPLGIDKREFHPLNIEAPWSTVEAKRKLRIFDAELIESSFLVLNAHRNQPRKRIDITLKAFAHFARGKPPNVQLYLHMGTTDLGWDVLKLAKRYGIDDRLIVSENRPSIPGVAIEHLNMIYNACDVGINTATGEGWGLPNFEHAATGKAQVVPRIGALAEIWSEAAEFVTPSHEQVYEMVHSEGKVVTPEGVASVLEELYNNRTRLRVCSDACFSLTQRTEHNWESIGRSWHSLFQDVLDPIA